MHAHDEFPYFLDFLGDFFAAFFFVDALPADFLLAKAASQPSEYF